MTAAAPDPAALIARSVRRYRAIHRRYERRHPEIFNPIEQARLRASVTAAVAAVRSAPDAPPHALDLGCGTGNLTGHLVAAGARVTAADVVPEFLETVRGRFGGAGVQTLAVNGLDLAGVADSSFDVAACYSVLHHVPDYLGMVEELCRVVKPGGVVYLDHEVNANFWGPDGCAHHFRAALARREHDRPGPWNPVRKRWQRYLIPANYVMGVRLLVDPDYRFGVEGDIHVWPQDHVEWDEVVARLRGAGCEIVSRADYLNYHAGYPDDLYTQWLDGGCTDMSCVVARRTAP